MACRSAERRTMEILEAVGLTDKAEAYARTLSGGMRRRLMVAKAMVHNPPVLVLDEPTAGVDVELRQQLWSYVRQLNANGTTVLLTTHYLEEAEELCDRIAIINHGRVIACDTTQALLRRLDSKELVFILADDLAMLPPALTRYRCGASGTAAAGAALSAERDAHRRDPGGSPDGGPEHRRHDHAGGGPGGHLPATDPRRPCRACAVRLALLMLAAFLGACAPRLQPPGPGRAAPAIAADHLVMDDGAKLPLRVWKPAGEPRAVILALHGFNDYSKAFEEPAKRWTALGISHLCL